MMPSRAYVLLPRQITVIFDGTFIFSSATPKP